MESIDCPTVRPDPALFRVQSLGSGSSGNAYLVQTGSDVVLIDCGIGIRRIQEVLAECGKILDDLAGLVITHEHSDHVRSLAPVMRRSVPVFATVGTANALGLAHDHYRRLRYLDSVTIGGLTVTPIPTSHDAAEPCGLLISGNDRTVGLITDLGCVTDEITGIAESCDLLILESNHDREMLRNGPYPAHLKRRVASTSGHLSNDQASGLIQEIATESAGPSDVWLAHLSATNNTPMLAEMSVAARYGRGGSCPAVTVLPRLSAGPVWNGPSARVRQLQLLVDG